jgi:hypothetical protein
MTKRNWIRRWLITLSGGGLLTLLLAVPAGNWFLRREVLRQVAAVAGGRVDLERVQVGWSHQVTQGLRVSAPGEPREWIRIERAELDVSVWDALRGDTTPREIRVRGATVRIPLDADGQLLIPLPAAAPGPLPFGRLSLQDGTLEIRQPTREALIVRGIQLRADCQGTRDVSLHGTVEDALDASWRIELHSSDARQRFRARLETDLVSLDTAKIGRYPLVPPITGTLSAGCRTPVELAVDGGAREPLSYRLQLAPVDLAVNLPGGPWQLSQGQGRVIAENGQITVREFRARLGGGELRVAGSAAYDQGTWNGGAEIALADLPMTDFHQGLDLPPWVQGRLTLQGNCEVTASATSLVVSGTASAGWKDAQLAGVSLDTATCEIALQRLAWSAGGKPEIAGSAEAVVQLADAELASILRAIPDLDHDRLPEITGRLTARAEATIPLDRWRDPQSWRVRGDLRSAEMTVDGIEVRDLQGSAAVQAGRIELDPLRFALAQGGVLEGSLTTRLASDATVRIQGRLVEVPVERFGSLLSEQRPRIAGRLSGQAAVAFPASGWRELTRWNGSGQLDSEALTAEGWTVEKVSAEATLEGGQLQLDALRGAWREASFQARGTTQLAPDFRGEFRFDWQDLQAARVADRLGSPLPEDLAATVAGDGRIQFQGTPGNWEASGRADVSGIRLGQLDAGLLRVDWEADPQEFRITQSTGSVAGATVQMTAEVPLDDRRPLAARGQFSNLSVRTLEPWLPALPVSLRGQMAGDCSFVHDRSERGPVVTASVRGFEAQYRGTLVRDVTANLSYRDRQLSARLAADSLGGRLTADLSGQLAPDATEPLSSLAGRAQLRGVQLGLVLQAAGVSGSLPTLAGVVSSTLQVNLEAPRYDLHGTGSVAVEDLRIGHQLAPSRMVCRIEFDPDAVRLQLAEGRLTNGQLGGELVKPLGGNAPASFRLNLTRLAIRPFVPEALNNRSQTDAVCDLTIEGILSRTSMGRGQLKVSGGSICGVRVAGLRAPFDWEWTPETRRAQASTDFRVTRLSGGQLSGRLRCGWNGGLWLDGEARLRAVDIQPIVRAARRSNDLLNGRLSGDVSLRGQSIRTLADLQGQYDVQLLKSRALALPVLDVLTNSLGFSSPGAATFDRTEATGRLSKGVLKVERMTMESSDARLWIEGQMTTGGRLDMEVTADSGQALALAATVVTARPWDLFRRRLIFLHLGGTVQAPIIQPRTAEFIQQEIILFLLPFVAPAL